jgi:hemolysin activation/secretion protein
MRERLYILLCVLFLWPVPAHYAAEGPTEAQKLQKEAENTGSIFKKQRRFVPIPIPIANPTVGKGLAVVGMYLHPRKPEDSDLPTSISGVMGMYTDSKSWITGVFHEGHYGQDSYRVRGLLGYGEFNLKFYGIGDDSILRDNPIDYEAKTTAFLPRLLFRLPVKNWFLGAQYLYMDIDATFKLSDLLPILPDVNLPTKTAGLGLVGVYDSRNNTLWPTDGTWFEITATDYAEYFGGDYDYQKYILKFSQYFPLTNKVTLAYRLDGKFIDGDAPFYDLSSLKLRGFAGGRYMDDQAVSAQVEDRWNFYKKWTVLLFVGAGRIADEVSELGSSSTNWAGGAGIRYMIAEEQKLNIGIDVAYGDGETAIYVQIGDWFAN